jgi:hypothetical protein
MRQAFLIGCFLILASLLNAQKIYFVYLQTEKGESFFIRMNDKLYSSAASGYLILPRLLDSTYNFKLGFPGKDLDLDFTTSINKRDHGYLIKDFGEKGWGLFDLQSLSVQMSSSNMKTSARPNVDSGSGVNAFTDMLSKAADDPSLKENAVFVKQEGKKSNPVQTVQKEDMKPELTDAVLKDDKKPETTEKPINKLGESEIKSPALNKQTVGTVSKKESVADTQEVYKRSQIERISGVGTTDGYETVYVDAYSNGDRDTVRILIPGETNPVISEEVKKDSVKEDKKFLDVAQDTVQKADEARSEVKKEETKKWGIFNKIKNASTDNQASDSKKDEFRKLWPFNRKKEEANVVKSCQTVADDGDFLRLRRKMAGRTNDEGMLDEAKKYFKEKCFTTEQIKNLSSMFLSNAGKYNFFEVARDHVSDKENFPSLQSELKDEYYVNRFKALLSN